jgi:hypothetical protein
MPLLNSGSSLSAPSGPNQPFFEKRVFRPSVPAQGEALAKGLKPGLGKSRSLGRQMPLHTFRQGARCLRQQSSPLAPQEEPKAFAAPTVSEIRQHFRPPHAEFLSRSERTTLLRGIECIGPSRNAFTDDSPGFGIVTHEICPPMPLQTHLFVAHPRHRRLNDTHEHPRPYFSDKNVGDKAADKPHDLLNIHTVRTRKWDNSKPSVRIAREPRCFQRPCVHTDSQINPH